MKEHTRRQRESGQLPSIAANASKWYIDKVLNKTVAAKQASSLQVSLRSNELRYDSWQVCHPSPAKALRWLVSTFRFAPRHGADVHAHQSQRQPKVLCIPLLFLSLMLYSRRETDQQPEYEIVKC
jgi:hypothetical protein